MECLKKHESKHAFCREETTAYLECRMNKGLMVEEDVKNFGLREPIDFEASMAAQNEYTDKATKKWGEGFVAGLHRAERRH